MNPELKRLLKEVRTARCSTIEDVRAVVEDYFQRITWSLLLDEWNRMTAQEKHRFVTKVFNDISSSATTEPVTCQR